MSKITCPIDTIMGLPWRSGLEVLTIQPAIASWDKRFESAIGDVRFEKNKVTGLEKLVYPLTRALFKLQEGLLKKIFYFRSILRDKKFKNE